MRELCRVCPYERLMRKMMSSLLGDPRAIDLDRERAISLARALARVGEMPNEQREIGVRFDLRRA